jgi:hypothetical protein
MDRRRHRALIVLTLAASAAGAYANTSAYWRHEEGVAGGYIPAGPDTVLDSSGNGNHMQTFNPAFTSGTYTSAVSPVPLRSGLPNTLAIDFGPGGDDPARNDDNYTSGKLINIQLFSAMTVELAFNMNSVNGWQALFGKDGKPLGDEPGEADSPVPPLKFLIRNDDFPNAIPNQLFVEFIDGDGDIHFVASGATVVPGQWNHVAFTLTGTTAELWLAGETGDYTLLDSITGDFAGPAEEALIFEPLGFSAGRGMFNNGVTDWADARIDEIRVSDVALTPDQFLFKPVPTAVPGDADGDGDADLDDIGIWATNFTGSLTPGSGTGTLGMGDFDGDKDVDLDDQGVWASNFTGSLAAASAAVAAVPEPSFAALGITALGVLRRRRS